MESLPQMHASDSRVSLNFRIAIYHHFNIFKTVLMSRKKPLEKRSKNGIDLTVAINGSFDKKLRPMYISDIFVKNQTLFRLDNLINNNGRIKMLRFAEQI
jgi:hypothetical protein